MLRASSNVNDGYMEPFSKYNIPHEIVIQILSYLRKSDFWNLVKIRYFRNIFSKRRLWFRIKVSELNSKNSHLLHDFLFESIHVKSIANNCFKIVREALKKGFQQNCLKDVEVPLYPSLEFHTLFKDFQHCTSLQILRLHAILLHVTDEFPCTPNTVSISKKDVKMICTMNTLTNISNLYFHNFSVAETNSILESWKKSKVKRKFSTYIYKTNDWGYHVLVSSY